MTLRELINELQDVAREEDALDAPLWFGCGAPSNGLYEISVSRPRYTDGVRTEVYFTIERPVDYE